MKKLCLFLSLVLSSCTFLNTEDKIWDIAPVMIRMEVVDAQGRNLFEETTPGNWISSEISARFEDESYTFPTVQTRAYMAVLYGLYLEPNGSGTGHQYPVLTFGELDGTEERNSDLVITWPDASEDIISVRRKFRWKRNGDPDGETILKINGKVTENPIRIVK